LRFGGLLGENDAGTPTATQPDCEEPLGPVADYPATRDEIGVAPYITTPSFKTVRHSPSTIKGTGVPGMPLLVYEVGHEPEALEVVPNRRGKWKASMPVMPGEHEFVAAWKNGVSALISNAITVKVRG
jgi:hypothetical protein